MVADKMVCVHGDRADHARDAESDDAPVVARPTAPPRLPAVHPLAAGGVLALDEHPAPGLEQVLLAREEFIARQEGAPPDPRRREVQETDAPAHAVLSSGFSHCPAGGDPNLPRS